MNKYIFLAILTFSTHAGFFAWTPAYAQTLPIDTEKSINYCVDLSCKEIEKKLITTTYTADEEYYSFDEYKNYTELFYNRTPYSQEYYIDETTRLIKYYGRQFFTGQDNLQKIIVEKDTTLLLNYNIWDRIKSIYKTETARAESTTTTTSIDASMISTSPDTNFMGGTSYYLGGTGTTVRNLITWTIPTIDGTITDVKLYFYNTAGSGTDTYNVHELSQESWLEDEVTWNSYQTGENWTTAGGDYEATVIDSTSCNGASAQWYNWTLQGEDATNPLDLESDETIYLLLKSATEPGNAYLTLNTNDAESNIPYLEITYSVYTPPEPATSTPSLLLDTFISNYKSPLIFCFACFLFLCIIHPVYYLLKKTREQMINS